MKYKGILKIIFGIIFAGLIPRPFSQMYILKCISF